ncbi:hypothetical protein ACHAWF_003341 [Thalassiosira exigua]
MVSVPMSVGRSAAVRVLAGAGAGASRAARKRPIAGGAVASFADGRDDGLPLRSLGIRDALPAPARGRRHLAHPRRPSPRRRQGFRPFSSAAAPDAREDDPGEGAIGDGDGDDGLDALPGLSAAALVRIRSMKSRHDETLEKLRGGGDQTALGRELSSLRGVASLCERAEDVRAERAALTELREEARSAGDGELAGEVEAELSRLEAGLPQLAEKMMKLLVPPLDPDEAEDLTSADAVIDIRAGTGGDEACLFASEIMAGYESAAKSGGSDESGANGKAWDVEVLSISRTDLGGVKEASLVVSSRTGGNGYSGGYSDTESDDVPNDGTSNDGILRLLGPYGFFQCESGVHRVQRVPVNDVKMQTSAVSVAVLPSVPDSRVSATLPSSELKIDTMRASGAGGQHVNTTNSAVRVTHIPTGIVAYMQEERSQHKNKSKALKLVAARVDRLRKEEARRDRSAARSSLMGGGDRSERVRTYNFPQDRITDHRCKVSVTGIRSWLGSGAMVRKFSPYLYKMEREERVAALEDAGRFDGGEDDGKKSRGRSKSGRRRKES